MIEAKPSAENAAPGGKSIAVNVSASPSGSLAETVNVSSAPSSTVCAPMAVNSGARLTLRTVIVTACVSVSAPSEAATATV